MGSLADMPHGSSPNLALAHPAPEEKLIQFKLNGAEWRGALSLDAYLRREDVLSQQSLTKDGGITYWILFDKTATSNPLDPASSTRLPLASCESYRKKALVWRNGRVQETVCHGIGSVFCAPHLRGRKYAQRMMQELGNALETHQTSEKKECLFTVLFSDIGKKFYANFGWEPFTSSHVSIPAGVSKLVDASRLPAARPLHAEDLAELCQIDEVLVRKSLDARPAGSNTAVALIPDVETIRWHHAREDFVGTELHRKTPKVKGAIVGAEKGKRVWCYWTRMWYNQDPQQTKGNTLHILRVVTEDEGQSSWEDSGMQHINRHSADHSHDNAIAALLLVAQREAEEWKMEEVEAWNPSSEMLTAARKLDPSAKVVDRDTESIASLKWYPAHEGPVAESIDWIGNEKYGWC
ncbi:hypothetical protein K458DRAFT_382753 [Lentithecium fluviatile CBS 122367]|uniref:LYC1 C-terminal domain-containing protein n=1 Tax=Lentithecium fluviatile CBS 122367 TaxID=1168545 RepID=A0A6G1JKU1_9PLEO|nr:hypothetical protein K458DRAFT_382753 [Lentithecium fluviatile CBS 122367]